MTRWMRLAVALGAALVSAACGKGGAPPQATQPPVVEVLVGEIRTGNVAELVSATGRTRVLRQENVGSPIEGKVVALRVLEGDRVRSGQVIGVVETKESLAARTGAELLVIRAQNAQDSTRALAALDRAQHNRATLEVRAPFHGVVVSRALNEGEFVTPGGTLATILDLESLYFIAKLPARDLARVRRGQPATVEFQSWPDRRFRCQVDNIQPQIDPVGQMAEVRLHFLGDAPPVRSDLFGHAEIEVGEHTDVLLAPAAALLRDDESGIHTVVEAIGDTIGIHRVVQVGLQTPGTVEISGPGLRAGTHVVIEGHYGLPDSTHIRLQKRAPRPEPTAAGIGSGLPSNRDL